MRRWSMLAALAAVVSLSFIGDSAAQTTTPPKYVFVTVDAVQVSPYNITVTGILEGGDVPVVKTASLMEPSSSSTSVSDLVQACQRSAFLAMERPGAYRLEIVPRNLYFYGTCALVRVNP